MERPGWLRLMAELRGKCWLFELTELSTPPALFAGQPTLYDRFLCRLRDEYLVCMAFI
jgi:hypothetical protein